MPQHVLEPSECDLQAIVLKKRWKGDSVNKGYRIRSHFLRTCS